jgi:midasin
MVGVMRDLKVFRQRNNFFVGREGVITVRDLIKWGKREVTRAEELAIEGYLLLAERLRNGKKKRYLKFVNFWGLSIDSEKEFVRKTIENHFKVTLSIEKYYEEYFKKNIAGMMNKEFPFQIQWNPSFIRMAVLTMKALKNNEPVLMVGETGCGKTTLTQLIAFMRKSR